MKRSPSNKSGTKDDYFKELMNIDVTGEETSYGSELPDVINMHEKLIMDGNLDDELEKAHVMYSFCTLLAEEFNYQARVEAAKLEKWSGEKWRKLKGSSKRKYTDQDAKRAIQANDYYYNATVRIAKLEKLYRQLAFGGGKAIDMGVQSLKFRVNMAIRTMGDFNITSRDLNDKDIKDKVGKKIKSRLKRKGDQHE